MLVLEWLNWILLWVHLRALNVMSCPYHWKIAVFPLSFLTIFVYLSMFSSVSLWKKTHGQLTWNRSFKICNRIALAWLLVACDKGACKPQHDAFGSARRKGKKWRWPSLASGDMLICQIEMSSTVARGPNFSISLTFCVKHFTSNGLQDQKKRLCVYR